MQFFYFFILLLLFTLVLVRSFLTNHYNMHVSLNIVFLMVDIMFCSTSSHTWDAFQLALASFRLYCIQNNVLPSNSHKGAGKFGPQIFGVPPNIDTSPSVADMKEEEEENSPETISAVKIYDDDVNMRFLVCGVPCTLVGLIL